MTVDISVLVALALFAVGEVATALVIPSRKKDREAEVRERLLAAYKEEAELEKKKRLELDATVQMMVGGFLDKLMIHVGEQTAKAVKEVLREERRS